MTDEWEMVVKMQCGSRGQQWMLFGGICGVGYCRLSLSEDSLWLLSFTIVGEPCVLGVLEFVE